MAAAAPIIAAATAVEAAGMAVLRTSAKDLVDRRLEVTQTALDQCCSGLDAAKFLKLLPQDWHR